MVKEIGRYGGSIFQGEYGDNQGDAESIQRGIDEYRKSKNNKTTKSNHQDMSQ